MTTVGLQCKYLSNYLEAIANPSPELVDTFTKEKLLLENLISSLPSGSIIIDAGCGVGRPLLELASKYTHFFIGTDIDTTMLNICMAKKSGLKNVLFLEDDSTKSVFYDSQAMMIYSTYNLIGSLPVNQRNKLLSEQKRITSDNGIILTSTWNQNSSTTDFLHEYYSKIGLNIESINKKRTITNAGTFYRLSHEEMIQEYNAAGISVEQIIPIGLWTATVGRVKK